jgi:hypothetical protein
LGGQRLLGIVFLFVVLYFVVSTIVDWTIVSPYLTTKAVSFWEGGEDPLVPQALLGFPLAGGITVLFLFWWEKSTKARVWKLQLTGRGGWPRSPMPPHITNQDLSAGLGPQTPPVRLRCAAGIKVIRPSATDSAKGVRKAKAHRMLRRALILKRQKSRQHALPGFRPVPKDLIAGQPVPSGNYASELLMLLNTAFTPVATLLMPLMQTSAIKATSKAYSTRS